MTERRPILAAVGGFLGAGKTTLLLAAAKILEKQGLRVAVLLNDQGLDLVDAEWSALDDVAHGSVSGGCFCCRFTDFLEAALQLRDAGLDVIFAEPVGSCTDLTATLLRPLQEDQAALFQLAPLTVLVDPASVPRLMGNEDTRFLFENQVAEADLVCYTKADLHSDFPPLNGHHPRRLSARTGDGVAEWLAEILSGDLPAATRTLDLDYSLYAAAETALGWLDSTLTLHLADALPPAMVAGPLLDEFDARLTAIDARIAHLKLLDRCESGWVKAALTANGQEPDVDGHLVASPAFTHEITLNLRAVAEPEAMRKAWEESLAVVPATVEMRSLAAFRPGAPQPPSQRRG